MADEAEEDVLELEEDQDTEEDIQGDNEEEDSQSESADEGDEDLEISFGDEAAPASDSETPLIKHLREQLRDRDRKLAEMAKGPVQKIEVGPKPTLAGCEYDEEAYEAELDAWKDRKAKAEQAETQAEAEARESSEAFAKDVQSYEARKAAMKFPDVKEAEEMVLSSLTLPQRAVMIKASDDPAKVMYALSKHPQKLAELAKVKDPIKMAAAVAKLEGTIKMAPRRKAPEPEEIATGTGSHETGRDKTLERLEKEADRTGDRTKVIAYKREQRTKAKK